MNIFEDQETVELIYVTGVEVDYDGYVVRLLGWIPHNGGAAAERRIIVRVAMSLPTAHQLRVKLQKKLGGA